jgi:hypothetical protein
VPETPGENPPVDLTPNPIIKRLKALAEETGSPEKIITLMGYLGDSIASDKCIELYLNLDLECYYRILKTDIVHTANVEQSDCSQPTKVLIRASARVEVVQTSEASFLSGSIAASSGIARMDPVTATNWLPKTYKLVETGPHCATVDCLQAMGGGPAMAGPRFAPAPTGPHCSSVDCARAMQAGPGMGNVPTGPHCSSVDCAGAMQAGPGMGDVPTGPHCSSVDCARAMQAGPGMGDVPTGPHCLDTIDCARGIHAGPVIPDVPTGPHCDTVDCARGMQAGPAVAPAPTGPHCASTVDCSRAPGAKPAAPGATPGADLPTGPHCE